MGPNGDKYWRDEHGLPSWLEVDFSGAKLINEVDVITTRDDYATQSDPSATQTFSYYGTTSYSVQYWNAATSAWVTVPGGSFTGNSLVWRKLSFPAVTTSKIKVTVAATADGVMWLTEVEAWGYETVNLQWLVTDQLGTPRMIIDKTGALASVKRHDYLPFGEELTATQGLRTTAQGYGTADGVRQKFTDKERDIETGLDYFGARYYASTQGRFISPDDFLNDTHISDPASWNLYTYVRNNPLRYIDQLGTDMEETSDKNHKLTDDQKKAIEKDLRAKTGLSTIHFDGKGKLTYDKGEKAQGGSAQLRQNILGAIDDKKNVFQIGNYADSNIQFAKTDAGTQNAGVTTYQVKIDFADFKDAKNLSDTAALESFTLALALDHEIDHKVSYDPSNPIPADLGMRPDESPRAGVPGVIDDVNVAQSQLGLMSRAHGSHEGIPYKGNDTRYLHTYHLQFNDPSGNSKFVRWKMEGRR